MTQRNATTRLILTTLCLATTAGCASAPARVNPWHEVERASTEVTLPVPLPTLADDLSNLDAVLEAAVANHDIAEQNALALRELSLAYNAALEAGSAENELSAIRAEMVSELRRARLVDRVSTLSVLALLGLLAL